ncbi:MAG: hypothetical protein V3T77_07075 [Planctomycetota bacterium]
MLRGLTLMALVCLWGIPASYSGQAEPDAAFSSGQAEPDAAFSSGQAEPDAAFTILYTISNQGFVDACG